MENYGFVLPSPDEVASLHLPKASGSFSELYTKMETTAKTTKLRLEVGQAFNMSSEEKQISFYNRYFVFKKVRNVDAEQLSLAALDETKVEAADMKAQVAIADTAIANASASVPLKPKRRKAPKLELKAEMTQNPVSQKEQVQPPEKPSLSKEEITDANVSETVPELCLTCQRKSFNRAPPIVDSHSKKQPSRRRKAKT